MHDTDRTARELEYALQELQPEHFEFTGEAEAYGETAGEGPMHEGYETGYETGYEAGPYETETGYETGYEAGQYEGGYELEMQESPLHEAMEMELAAELLEVTNEAELDRFLGNLIKRVGRTVGRVVRSPIGRALGGVLKPLAKAALPIAGRAVGTFFGGPVGGMIGGKLADTAGRLFGLELEGLSAEDREFEVARRYVRLAATAANNATTAPPNVDPQSVARGAVAAAARVVAPGLTGVPRPQPVGNGGVPGAGRPYSGGFQVPTGGRRRGIWVRRGRSIILHGV